MNTNRPRESVISLFDPLNTPPDTPTREVHTPDSASDKENDAPSHHPGQLTSFFNRIYTNPKMVKAPRGKLIDFEESGELAAVEQHDATGNASGDVAGQQQHASDGATEGLWQISNWRRYPQRMFESRPRSWRSQPSAHPPPSSPSSWSDVSSLLAHACTSAAPAGAPLADVINAINLGSLDINAEAKEHATASSEETLVANCPDITVVPPESEPSSPNPSMPVDNYVSPFLSPVAPPPVFSPPIRRQHVSTSPNDPRRISVDLHSSFSIQLQSPEMSFDLLNDKISFLSQGQDSFWTAADEDDTMDLAKEEFKMKMIAERYESIKEEDEIEPVPDEKLQCISPSSK
ncbi:hypothetical protein NM688_g5953 [Phlebia brevispora]|uniref:Uncharacterized protein n=1 Tax=Phlebia brevispora TaxID=194682 RepID=A0ACC1SML0_9APHY|nr:hypothetical protein NM688_g5953 [Phlebia brevispora]